VCYLSQLIALSSRYDITEIPFTPNYDSPTTFINPTSEITTILESLPTKTNRLYYMIIYDWNILVVDRIFTPSFRTRLVNYR
jgi:hypothetical protein